MGYSPINPVQKIKLSNKTSISIRTRIESAHLLQILSEIKEKIT